MVRICLVLLMKELSVLSVVVLLELVLLEIMIFRWVVIVVCR